MTEELQIKLLRPHKHYRTKDGTDLWKYAQQWMRYNSGELFEYDRIVLVKATIAELDRSLPKNHSLRDFTQNVIKAFPDFGQSQIYSPIKWARTPDGTWFFQSESYHGYQPGWRTAIEDPNARRGYYRFYHMNEEALGTYGAGLDSIDDDEFIQPCWLESYKTIVWLEENFKPAFRTARKEWLKKEKAAGRVQQYQEENKKKKEVRRTKRKMEVCDQTTTVIQSLQQYLNDINNGTATQKQVGELYREMNKLSSLNKKVKTLFPKE